MEKFSHLRFPPSDKTLHETVKLCLKIDILSHLFYKRLSKTARNRELRDFWAEISAEEKTHIDFWRKTLLVAQKGLLPQIFDDPEKVQNEIHSALLHIKEIITEENTVNDTINDFIAAFKVEFHGMHPGLAPLFNIMKIISTENNPEDIYDKHIMKFLNMFNKYCGHLNHAAGIIGETILRLWQDNRKLSSQCYTDDLTTLLNRRGFFRIIIPMLELARRNKTMVALMIADIDHFKNINDSLGHQAGDQVLAALHKIFNKTFRASDLVCRYGGDEFIIFCPEIKKGGGKIIAEKLRKAISKVKIGKQQVTLSIGVVETVPRHKKDINEELESVIKTADRLLYEVKGSGRNNIICKTV